VSELTLLIFRIAFLIALWVFVFFVVYAVRSDLFGEKVKRLIPSKATPAPNSQSVFLTSAQTPLAASRPAATATPAAAAGPLTLIITAGAKQGESITLTSKPVSIGRSSDSSIVIRDDYTSTHHARLEYRSGTWIINDLGSTNGTFLAGAKVTEPTEVPLNTPLTIGATTFEIRASR
jgi:pSer/pThr/pTyr-binding forkhead associated (FHA) protein